MYLNALFKASWTGTCFSVPKIWITMQLTGVIILACCLQVSAAAFGQKVTIRHKTMTLKDVFKDIRKQTGYNFIYSDRTIEGSGTITLNVKDAAIRDVLNQAFEGLPLSYTIENNVIIVKRTADLTGFVRNPELTKVPDQKEVSGIVTDSASRQPMVGVTIRIKGTGQGTTTDKTGRFTLSVPDDAVLIVSYLGYGEKEVSVAGRSTLRIVLASSATGLDQLMVIGYGTQKAKDITGSVVRIDTKQTSDLPDYSVFQSIQGRVAGINVTTPVRPGGVPGILIRGRNSIIASNSPLVVVDGVIFKGDINNLNTNDIASIDILKDASAAAVYGSRAANGVLLITTKSGTSSKPQFNFDTYQAIENAVHLIHPLDGPGYILKMLDYRTAVGLEANPDDIDKYLTVVEAENYDNGKTINWLDRVIQTGVTSNYHLDVSGKTDKTNYYVSGTLFKQKGIVVNDNWRRITLNLNLTNHITDWFSISLKSAFATRDWDGLPADMSQAFRQSPYGSLYDEDGPGGYALYPVGDPLGINPFINTLIDYKRNITTFWGVFSSQLDIPFIPGLKWTLNYSPDLRISNTNEFRDNETTTAGITANGIATKDQNKYVDWTFDNILNYRRTFGEDHSLYVTLLYSREGSNLESSGLEGKDFFTQILGYNDLGLAGVQTTSSNYEDENSLSYMARINYSYKDKYAATFTARRDGFSGFSENHKYATFPSVALAWTATNERFLSNVSWLSYLKLRLSYGMNGNQAVGRYQSLARMSSNKYVFGPESMTTIYESSMANDQLAWETTTAKNIGIDFEVLRQRLNGSIDVYASETKDLLLRRNLPETSGFQDILTNIGEVHNQGVEVTLNSVNIKNDRIEWRSGLTFSLNRNRIDELTGQGDDIRDGWFIGKPLGSIYGYKTDGVYQLTDDDILSGFKPGDFRIVDVDHSGKITAEDRVILGNTLPNYIFSISNTIQVRNFSFYLLINSIQGGHGYYLGNNNATRNPNAPFTTYTERFNVQNVPYWTPSRSSNKYPIINYNPPYAHPILEDRSFVRIQDVSLSYTFGRPVLDRLKLNSLKLYASVKNLYTFTKWTGCDPENATGVGDFPLMRMITLGVNFSF